MKRHHRATLAGFSVCAGIGHVFAASNDPADASAPVPPAMYQSPFADYRVLGEDKSTPWQEANDTVGKIGGWRAYAREAADTIKAREAANAMKAREAAGAVKAKPPTPSSPPSPPSPPQPPAVPPAPPAPPHKHGG